MIKQRFYNFLMVVTAVAGSAAAFAADAPATGAEGKCEQLYNDGRYASAYNACKPLADDGGAIASFVMSNLHARGLGGAKADVSQALVWLKVAAEADYGPASYNLAALYESGEVVEQSLPEAFNWYRRGAEAGHTESQLKAGVMLLKGDGVTANYQRAQEWLEKSAVGGDSNAQVTLAILQATAGDKQALHWYQQAAEQNNAFALHQLADVYAEGKLGEQVDLAKALRLARQSLGLGRLSSKRMVEKIEDRLAKANAVPVEPSPVAGSMGEPESSGLVTAGLLTPETMPSVKQVSADPMKKMASSAAVTSLNSGSSASEPVSSRLSNSGKTVAGVKAEVVSQPAAKVATAKTVRTTKTTKTTKASPVAANFRDKDWLMQQPDQRIVMQLAQISEKAAVGRYIEKYGLHNQVDYYRAHTRAGLVYVLLYHRNYETVTKSKEIARQVLAEGVQKGVWYRRFSTLQSDYVAPDGES